MNNVLKNYIIKKYNDKFIYLSSLSDRDRPLPQQTIYNTLKDLINEFVNEAQIRPYKELLIRIENLLNSFNINHKKLTYNNFYMFLKKNKIIHTEKKTKEENKNNMQDLNTATKKYLRCDPVDSLTNI